MKKLIFLAAFCCMVFYSQAQKISAMPSASSITGVEYIPIVQSSTNKKVTPLILSAYFETQLDSASARQFVLMSEDSTITYVTPYQLSQLPVSSGIGFATYDSLSTDSTYFNTLTHKLRVRHNGWWYGFTPSDSTEIYIVPTPEYGNELNPSATFDAGWAQNGGWTIGSGSLNKWAASTAQAYTTSEVLTTTKTYHVVYTISSVSAGTVAIGMGSTAGASRSAPGTYTEDITCSVNGYILITPDADFLGTITFVSVKEVL